MHSISIQRERSLFLRDCRMYSHWFDQFSAGFPLVCWKAAMIRRACDESHAQSVDVVMSQASKIDTINTIKFYFV